MMALSTSSSGNLARTTLRPGASVVLYGAGNVGRDAARCLADHGVRVLFFMDRVPAAHPGLSLPVYGPEACPLTESERASTPVVITIFNRDVDVVAIANHLKGLGFDSVVTFVDLHAAFPDRLGDRYWLTRREFVAENVQEISALESAWADEGSRELFRSMVSLRLTGQYSAPLLKTCGGAQYFPDDVRGWLQGGAVRFVDCGAYTGDTLRDAVRLEQPIAAWAHFEPDPDNFCALAAFVRERATSAACSHSLWPCAVSDRTRAVAFAQGLGEGSRISDGAGAAVQGISLDDALAGWRPTVIKMDIEGAEPDALIGARRLIGASRPSLAVCVYHRPDHLWRIPALLRGWEEMRGYDYYLRVHGYNGFDAVLYARPGIRQGQEVRRDRS